MHYPFKKNEKLCSKIDINKLFVNGNQFLIYPIKIIWSLNDDNKNSNSKVLFVVPKRLFKKAVHRNRIKRQLRELYRLNKNILYDFFENKPTNLNFVISYISNEMPDYNEINSKIILAFERLLLLNGKNIH